MDRPATDLRGLHDWTCGDEGMVAEFVQRILVENKWRLAELQVGVEEGTATQLAERIHQFRGMLAHVGARHAIESARTLEDLVRANDATAFADEFDILSQRVHTVVEELEEWLQLRPRDTDSMRILVADEDVISRQSLQTKLRSWGYGVEAFDDGRKLLSRLAGDDASRLAVIDWQMPGITGIDLCRELRGRERGTKRYTYVLMLTTHDEHGDLLAGFAAGVDDFLSKPVDPAELRARLGVGIRVNRLRFTINRLKNLLPMCAWCKEIHDERDDTWRNIEDYLQDQTGTDITHGICPSCSERVEGELHAEAPL